MRLWEFTHHQQLYEPGRYQRLSHWESWSGFRPVKGLGTGKCPFSRMLGHRRGTGFAFPLGTIPTEPFVSRHHAASGLSPPAPPAARTSPGSLAAGIRLPAGHRKRLEAAQVPRASSPGAQRLLRTCQQEQHQQQTSAGPRRYLLAEGTCLQSGDQE